MRHLGPILNNQIDCGGAREFGVSTNRGKRRWRIMTQWYGDKWLEIKNDETTEPPPLMWHLTVNPLFYTVISPIRRNKLKKKGSSALCQKLSYYKSIHVWMNIIFSDSYHFSDRNKLIWRSFTWMFFVSHLDCRFYRRLYKSYLQRSFDKPLERLKSEKQS